MKRLMIIAVALLSTACTDPDLSTPEGRAEHARIRAVSANIWKDALNSFPTQTPAPTMTICTPAGYILVCQ